MFPMAATSAWIVRRYIFSTGASLGINQSSQITTLTVTLAVVMSKKRIGLEKCGAAVRKLGIQTKETTYHVSEIPPIVSYAD